MPQILVCGDVRGRLGRLYRRVQAVSAKSGPFDCVLCVGDFFPREADATAEAHAQEEIDLADYVSGSAVAPVPTYFISGGDRSGRTWASALGKSNVLCKGIEYLGAAGVATLHGLTVGYVSGTHEGRSESEAAAALGALAAHAAKGGFTGVDILLSSEWPAGIAAPEFNSCLSGSGSPPSPPAPPAGEDGRQAGSVTAACAAVLLQPRYHFAAGAGVAWARAAQEQPSALHVGRFVGLAPLPPAAAAAPALAAVAGGGGSGGGPEKKYLHALALATTLDVLTPAELWSRPAIVTPCPFAGLSEQSFPPSLRAAYPQLLRELCGGDGGGDGVGVGGTKKKKMPERRAVAAVGYSDSDSDSSDDDDDSEGADEDEDDSDEDEDTKAERLAERAAKRRRTTAAAAAATQPALSSTTAASGGGGGGGLGSAADLFAEGSEALGRGGSALQLS
eukprot:COSAG01_NODE_8600_length_2721_cov_5.810141_3_plen_447_part_01